MHHYTNKKGYNAIKATHDWRFLASQPSAPTHEFGAYFTNLEPSTPKLARRMRIPREKTLYVFRFADAGDLIPLRGDRGEFVFYSKSDYIVIEDRQTFHGERKDWQ
jgi:hypothetical protein